MSSDNLELYFQDWRDSEAVAESMIPLIGKLHRENNVVITLYAKPLINRSVIDILKAHQYVRHVENNELSVSDTYPILQALTQLDLGYAHVDLGKMALKYQAVGAGQSVAEFVEAEVNEVLGNKNPILPEPQDVVLYGFGRIGRLLARLLIEKTGGGETLRLRAIVVRPTQMDDLAKRASLFIRDSIHGPFQGTVTVDEEKKAIVANGNLIYLIHANSPDEIDYTQHGINNAIVVDNTGKWSDEEGLGLHLKSKGVAKVLLTAPGKGEVKNIVLGINHNLLQPGEKIVSAASCTTNAIVPVLKVINDKFGIDSGHVETVHSYTNDQNLIDNFHKGPRRGRSAPLNMVITTTGAAKAVAKALPELKGKLTGNAIRVPTPNVSLALLNLNLGRETSLNEVNDYLREIAFHSPFQKQIDYVQSDEVVSSDFVGSRSPAIVDAAATIVEGSRCVLYVWYDNEFGYSCQVIRLLRVMANMNYPVFPAQN